jgi:hypothetical protein
VILIWTARTSQAGAFDLDLALINESSMFADVNFHRKKDLAQEKSCGT